MVDEAEILKIAEFKTRESGAVDYWDFFESGEAKTGWDLFKVKKILLDSGYECHEKRHLSEWRGSCGYQKRRTHFHRR